MGLWRSTDDGRTWQDVPLNLKLDPQGCALASLRDFTYLGAASPPAVFTATSDKGLLRSTDDGATWGPAAAETLPAQLTLVAASAGGNSLVLVAAFPSGVYRSLDGGETFSRLDGAAACQTAAPGLGSLPGEFTAGALLVTPAALYVGSSDGVATLPTAGLYASRDGGNCWLQLEPAAQRYGYERLAPAPEQDDVLLVLTKDRSANTGENSDVVWQFDARPDTAASARRLRALWSGRRSISALYAAPGAGGMVYVATEFGLVGHGPAASSQGWTTLPPVRRCLLACEVDLTADSNPATPLLLAGGRVYRLATVPWWRRLWP